MTSIKDRKVGVVLDEKDRLIEIYPFSESSTSRIGAIYVGRVQTIKKNIDAAFVDIGGENVFISLKEAKHIFYAKKHGKCDTLVQGDEIIVQIQKDAYSSKLAKAITDFCLTGKYLVLTTDEQVIHLSSKIIDKNVRNRLKKLLREKADSSVGFIIRTNSQIAEEDVILSEMELLMNKYTEIINKLPYRQKGQELLVQAPEYITTLSNMYEAKISRYIYDDEQIYNNVYKYVEEYMPSILDKLELVDGVGSLAIKLSLEQKIEKLFRTKVWLSSGASIIIEPTEALTVVDVNTEKSLSKKNADITIYRTNIEAADMIMYQIRARNISGIIIVDFIDMYNKEKKHELIHHLRELAKKDPMKTVILGMTKLGLVEITRKKSRADLDELWHRAYKVY